MKRESEREMVREKGGRQRRGYRWCNMLLIDAYSHSTNSLYNIMAYPGNKELNYDLTIEN